MMVVMVMMFLVLVLMCARCVDAASQYTSATYYGWRGRHTRGNSDWGRTRGLIFIIWDAITVQIRWREALWPTAESASKPAPIVATPIVRR